MYVKGFAIDETKVHEIFAPQLKEKVDLAYPTLIDVAKDQGFDLVLGQRNGHRNDIPHVLVLASDFDKNKLETTPVENDGAGWLEQFLEEEVGVFEIF